MAKEAPAITFTYNSNDISNDIVSLDFATPRGVQDVTGIDKSAMERLLLLADFTCTVNGVFNDAASQIHANFKTVPTDSTLRTLTIAASGQTLTITSGAIETDYQLRKAQSGELTVTVPIVLGSGTAPSWS